MFVRPPDDIKEEGKIWKLLKPFYGLDENHDGNWFVQLSFLY